MEEKTCTVGIEAYLSLGTNPYLQVASLFVSTPTVSEGVLAVNTVPLAGRPFDIISGIGVSTIFATNPSAAPL